MTKIALIFFAFCLFGFLVGFGINSGKLYDYKITDYKII